MATKKKTTKKTKRKVAGRTARKRKLPGWIILLSGVLFGLLIAVVGYINGWVPKPDNPNNKPVASLVTNSKTNDLEDQSEDLKIEKKNNFDFYDSLKDMEVDIDEGDLQQTQNRKPKTYNLQLGSFKKLEDAEAYKAKIAFVGYTAIIVKVIVNQDQWHRVTIGPYKSSRKADEDLRKLQNSGFDPFVVKL